MEDLIWDTITNSAKTKFDYVTFSKDFNEIDDEIADNILFKLIIELASGETKETISNKIYMDVLMLGFKWDKAEIDEFIKDKDLALKLEIYVAGLANDMLQQGNSTKSVLNSINTLLM
ncbi:hypothetical protein [Yeosuana sp.]|uniref:hypothetical protein n=1 Tax=Yeosuana sp. TaxID=2529388 RepID=UPI004054D5CA